jgi:putative FmdB family regulatory protein
MPIYEYSCSACADAFETLILRKSDEGEVACPACGSRRVERRMSRPAALRGGRAGSSSGRPPPNCGPIG